MYALVVTEPEAFDKAVNTTVNATGVGMLDSRCTNALRTGACSGLRTGLLLFTGQPAPQSRTMGR